MVFDWDRPVAFSADVINSELVLRFDRPVTGEFRGVLRPLAGYLLGVSVSADRKTATFPLAHPVQVKAFGGKNNAVVVDLVDLDAAGQPVVNPEAAAGSVASDAKAPKPAAQGAAPSAEGGPVSLLPSPQPSSAPVVPGASPTPPPPAARAHPAVPVNDRAANDRSGVDVRAAEHGTFFRIVFDWPRATDYKVEKQGGRAAISFTRPGRLDLSALQTGLPSDLSLAATDTPAGGTPSLALNLPPNARLRHFASGNKVVVDIVRAADAPAPANARATPLAPPPGADVAVPALQPLVPQEGAKLPSETLAAAPRSGGPSPVKPIPEEKKTTESTRDARGASHTALPKAKAAGTPAGPAAGPSAARTDKVFSLSVAWEKPVAAAVFQRAGYLWLVFDRYQEVDTKLMRRLGGEAVVSAEQLPNKEATVLRLVVQPDYAPSMRRDGLMWIVDLSGQPLEPKAPINVTAPASLPTGVGISLGISDPGNRVTVHDPEVGDTMAVVPVIPTGAGVYPGHSSPDLDLLPTVQGIAVVPHVDGLDIKSSRSGVTIGFPAGGGLQLSEGSPQVAKVEAGGAIFDVPAWARAGKDDFPAERRIIEAGLVNLPAARRSAAHLQAARFFFANGYAAEALGYLHLAAAEDPAMANTPAFLAVRGACQALMERWDLAQADLDNPILKDDAESQFWRVAAHAGGGDGLAEQDKPLGLGLALIRSYPHRLKWPLAALAVRAALAAADDDTAQAALDLLDRDMPSKAEVGQLDYLHGGFDELSGDSDKAVDDYQRAAEGDNREYRARATLAATELGLKLKRIAPKEAADRLDHLRFSWREEDFEFGLLRRFAELQLEAGDYPTALRALRSLAGNYPDNNGAPQVTQMMIDTFAKLYLDGAADSLSPVSAIALYDEFRELTPQGPKGDEMIRKLADRLAAVDLLDRAAALLQHQVTYRLQGLDKARVGAQVGLLDLLNRQPQAALDALQQSDVPALPAELQKQRRELKARALADLDRVAEAIQALAGDDSSDAAELRAEIYWRTRDWLDAGAAFESLVQRPQRGAALDDSTARLVLTWATALSLGNDERGLAALRHSFGPAMASTPYKDGFDLLTSAMDRDVPDLPAVAAKIREAEGFQSFMSNYKQRLQASGLSKIN
jgi:hypothetical protein